MNTAFRASVNLNFHWGDEGLRYGFNGIEKNSEGASETYAALYRLNDTRLGRWFSVDPKSAKFPYLSPYVSMNNNPVSVVDPLGDEVFIAEAFKNNKSAMNALKLMMMTEEGRSFIGMYAAKGQAISGHTYTSNGKYHSKSIDLTLDSKGFSDGDTGGDTPTPVVKGGRLNITVFMSNSLQQWSEQRANRFCKGDTKYSETFMNSRTALLSTSALMHELFVHVNLWTLDWLDDGKLWDPSGKTDEHHPRAAASLFLYSSEGYKSNSNYWWPVAGFSVLQQANVHAKSGFAVPELYTLMYESTPYVVMNDPLVKGQYLFANLVLIRQQLIDISTGKMKIKSKD